MHYSTMLLDNLNNDFLLPDHHVGHDESSMLRNFVSSEDRSSYATADEGNGSLQDHSRTCLNNGQAMDKTYEGPETGSLDEPAGNVHVAQQILGETARQKAVKSRFREDFKEINKAKHHFRPDCRWRLESHSGDRYSEKTCYTFEHLSLAKVAKIHTAKITVLARIQFSQLISKYVESFSYTSLHFILKC